MKANDKDEHTDLLLRKDTRVMTEDEIGGKVQTRRF